MGGGKISPAWRRGLFAVAAAALAALALRAALHGLDWATLGQQVNRLDPRWLAVAVLFDIISYAAQGLRWRCLLEGASLFQTTRAIYAGLFLNEVVPLRPGEVVRAWLAARDLRVGLGHVAPTMLAERLMDGIWLAVALLVVLGVAPLPLYVRDAAWLVAAIVALLVIAALLPGWQRYPFLANVRGGLSNRPAFAISGLFLLSQGLAFWAVGRASHLGLGVLAAFVVMMVVRLGTLLPGAPANLGTHQYATVLGLSLYGVPKTVAAGFSVVLFVVLTAPLLAIGCAACLNAGLTSWKRLQEVTARSLT